MAGGLWRGASVLVKVVLVTAMLVTVTLALVGLGGGATVEAGGRMVTRARGVVASGGAVTVSGFAVPVGIPVAAASGPLVVYSYRDAVGAATTGAMASGLTAAGAGCGCTGCGCGRAGGTVAGPEPVEGEVAVAGEMAGGTVLRQRCGRCHSGEAAKGGLRMWEAEGGVWSEGWRGSKRQVFAAIREGRMPRGGPVLSEEEFTAVVEYLLEE